MTKKYKTGKRNKIYRRNKKVIRNKTIDVNLSGCAIIVDNKLLLLKKFKNDYFEFPGGKLDAGETIKNAAIRECKEEIGCNVKIIKKFGFLDFLHKKKNVRSNIFIASIDTKPKIMEKEIFEKMIWISLNDYEEYPLAPNVYWFCRKYLE